MAGECLYVARRHDREAISHLLRTTANGLLADPGVGKTGEVLATFMVLKEKRLVDHVLVVGPLNPVYETWPAEIQEWNFPFKMEILHGGRRAEALATDADIYGINYDGLPWLAEPSNIERLLAHGKKWWLILDESTKIKHTNTKRFKILRTFLHRFPRRTILTGTPSPNGLMDLFGQVWAVDFGERLGRYITQYRNDFFYPTGYGGYHWVPQENAEERIYKRLDGMFYRIDDSVLELPPIHDVPRYITLSPRAQKVYRALETEFVAELRGNLITALNAGIKSMRLRQVANGRLYNEDGKTVEVHQDKIESLVDLVEQLQGNPILIGYEFTSDGLKISKALKAPIVSGQTSMKERKKLYAAFNAGDLPALVCQNETVALGTNLQKACHTVALFGLTWNLETYIQFRKRIHRGGQKHPVTVHHIIARNTIEDTVQWPTLKRKEARQAALLAAIKKRYL